MYAVLLVDDFADYTDVVSECLTMAGWDCTVAGSASEALQRLAQNPRFNVVAVDLMMEGGSGVLVIQECERIGIPAIVVTALSLEAAQRVCPRDVTIVTKPFDFRDFERALQEQVNHRDHLLYRFRTRRVE